MAETMANRGVQMFAMSSDPPSAAARHAARDGLRAVGLLADPELDAIAKLGLIHPRGWPFVTKTIAGIPLGVPTLPRKLGIPTTILIDATGLVRWIDRADDYRIRGDRARVDRGLSTLST